MSKFIKLTKKDGGKILINLDLVFTIADDVEHGYTVIVLNDTTTIENVTENCEEIFTLINL